MPRALFICGKNRLRSPTAEQVFATWPGVDVASAGLSHDAPTPLSGELVEWADIIFVMERAHASKLRRGFRRHLRGQRIVCLGIADTFSYMQPALVELIIAKAGPFLAKRS